MVGSWGLEPQTSTVSISFVGFTTTCKTAGTAKVRGSRTRHSKLWVELWVEIFTAEAPITLLYHVGIIVFVDW